MELCQVGIFMMMELCQVGIFMMMELCQVGVFMIMECYLVDYGLMVGWHLVDAPTPTAFGFRSLLIQIQDFGCTSPDTKDETVFTFRNRSLAFPSHLLSTNVIIGSIRLVISIAIQVISNNIFYCGGFWVEIDAVTSLFENLNCFWNDIGFY